MSLWKLLGIVAGVALAGAAVYAGVKLTQAYLRKKAIEEARRRQIAATQMIIKKKLQSGDHAVAKVGLLDDDMCEQAEFNIEGESFGSDIREGQILSLAA